ncbi:hypothetical protein GWG54_00915 [Natronococcus sp. JC468]|uniref:hypothetical protein n=1 Tax=Natronococcus sp. JC468 TaxID=1961921 RepID=UPI00143A3A29|nr:hypothetical protein [Natronococcus sp. JC468]NKE34393.1 hypothetical protein [Natronococcus sp. JC468]
MNRTEQVFEETTKLLSAVHYSLSSDDFPDRSTRDTLLVGLVYAATLVLLPFAVGVDLFNVLAHW